MTIIKSLALFFSILFLSPILEAQQVSIVSHYSATGFMKNRLLPFSVKSSGSVVIVSVSLLQGDGCKAFPDKFYNDIFHLYCTQETQALAEVVYLFNGTERLSSTTSTITIVDVANPSSNPTPTSLPTGSLFNKGEGE